MQRIEKLQEKAAQLQMLANEMIGELNTGVGEAREMADGLKRLLRSARAEQAGDVEFTGEGVGASRAPRSP